jgi:hypothetical protein
MLVLASTVILVSEIHGTHDHILQTPIGAFRLYISMTCLLTDGLTAKLLLALASTVILGSEVHGTHDHILQTPLGAVRLYISMTCLLTD